MVEVDRMNRMDEINVVEVDRTNRMDEYTVLYFDQRGGGGSDE